MIRYILVLFSVMCLSACENTNVLVMTDAAADAVSAITLTDADVRELAQRSAQASDSKFSIAPVGNPYDTRLRKLLEDYPKRDGVIFNVKAYLTKDVNAFAMADGTIRVYSGLMDLMSDEELLFVIGHEMGHVVKKHSRKKVVVTYASSALRKGLASQNNEVGQIARSLLGAFAEQLTNAQFSQHEERQADQYGASFLQEEGYDIVAAISALEKLAVLAAQHTFLSSHPNPKARAKLLLQGADSQGEDEGSMLARLLDYGKVIAIGLINVVLALVTWIFSLWS
jgi:putative metalloprotease